LSAACRSALRRHFAALTRPDLHLRFGGYRTPESLDAYVNGIDFQESTVLGVYDDELELLGAAHLSPQSDGHELGLSVLPAARGRGIGTVLLRRAIQHSRLAGAHQLYMHCLAENDALMRLARAVGAKIIVSAGEADGVIEIPAGTPFGGAVELVEEQIAVFDFGMKVQRRAARTLMDAVLRFPSFAAPGPH
jgi:GNAT superfamily N-acetyltransferase